jgi:predicted lactoylglutathione lyase
MSKQVFINVPANDLKLARDFYTKIGFSVKEEYSNDMALAVYLDEIYIMLVSESFFKQITDRDIADTSKVSEVAIAISLASNEEVDSFFAKAKAAGAPWTRDAEEEEPGLYAASFRDPFGHHFAVHHMNMG